MTREERIWERLKDEELDELVEAIAEKHKVPVNQILGRDRRRRFARARHAVWHAVRNHPIVYYSYEAIGDMFDVHYSTVIVCSKKYEQSLQGQNIESPVDSPPPVPRLQDCEPSGEVSSEDSSSCGPRDHESCQPSS